MKMSPLHRALPSRGTSPTHREGQSFMRRVRLTDSGDELFRFFSGGIVGRGRKIGVLPIDKTF